jgi:predicted nucleic acid-binding protein
MSAESSREFVDTNILVYAYDRSAGAKRERARSLVADLWRSGMGCLSLQVLQELFVAITVKVPKRASPARAARLVADLSRWTLHAPGREDLLRSIEIQQRFRVSLWDALIIQSAGQLGCRVLWSEDLNSGQSYGPVVVRNPFS